MSIASKQVNTAIARSTETIFKKGTIPNILQILADIEGSKLVRILGMPTFEAITQTLRSKSNVDDFNINVFDFIEDMVILYNEQIDQGTQINRQLAASEIEFRKLINDIRQIGDLANEVVLANDILRRHGFYAFDTFNNTDKLDMARTTAFVDIEAGTLEIPSDRSIKIDMSHLFDQDAHAVTLVTPGGASVAQVAGTRFGNMFDGTISSWIISVTTSALEDRAKIRFEFPLGNRFSPSVDRTFGQEFNRLIIRPIVPLNDDDRDRAIVVSYKNSFTDDFETLPLNEVSFNGSDIVMDINLPAIAGWGVTPPAERYIKTHISHLRFEMSKTIPDLIIANQNIYFFSLASIDMYRIKYRQKAKGISKSNQIKGNNPIGTLNNVSMAASHHLPIGTMVSYFVAEDNYLPGVFVDQSGEFMPPESPFVVDFVQREDMNNPESSGVLQTELREWAIQQTGFVFQGIDYKTWEPDWRKIVPVDGVANAIDDGEIGDMVVKFENVAEFDTQERSHKSGPLWSNPSGLPEEIINSISYYRVIEFYDALLPNSLVVRQGKDAWICIDDRTDLIKTVQATGVWVDDEGTDPPTYVSPGTIVKGSVRDVKGKLSIPFVFGRPFQSLIEDTDYFVEYGDNFVNVIRNYGTAGSIAPLGSDNVKFKVDYRIGDPSLTWTTHYHLDRGVDATVLVNMSGVKIARVINRDENTGIIIGEFTVNANGIIPLHQIGAGQGWFSLIIEVNSTTWSPTEEGNAKVTRPSTVRQYAWLSPLRPISSHDMTQLIAKENHDYTTVVYPDTRKHFVEDDGRASVRLWVNDPTYPPASGSVLSYGTTITHETLENGLPLGATGIFASDETVSQFYDVAYTSISEVTDHVLVRMDLETRDPNVTPRIDGYAVRVLN